MKTEDFTEHAPGRLLSIPGGHAFLPNPLPPELPATWVLSNKLVTATAAIAAFAGRDSTVPNHRLLVRALLAREAVDSNRIEGINTRILEVLTQEAAGPGRDERQASRNLEVIRAMETAFNGEEWLSQGGSISAYLIRALHRTLLTETRGGEHNPGEFRTRQVVIGRSGDDVASASFVPCPPEYVTEEIDRLVQFITNDTTYPPLVTAALVHYQFETIHPFMDGNGRLGRVLITLFLLARNAIRWPLVFLSPYLNDHRADYLRLLREVSTDGAWEPWVSFFLDAALYQAEDGMRRAKTMLDLYSRYRDSVLAASRSTASLRALDVIMERAVVTIPQVATRIGVDYRTAKTALELLRKLEIAAPVAESHPQLWVANELVEQVYED